MQVKKPFHRVILIVMDSAGIGEMPDAAKFGDAGSDTIGHVVGCRNLELSNFQMLGLGNIRPIAVPAAAQPLGSFGKAAIASDGKDTTTGHWEMAGIITERAFPTYPDGFPPRIVSAFEQATGRQVLGNKPASGTEIIKELGDEHVRTGKPIVYTSADSVFQIAAHEEVISVDELYRLCAIAREMLKGEDEVGRVIARPFAGTSGSYARTHRRKDFAVPPPKRMLLDELKDRGFATVCVGKIASIFCYRSVTEERKGKDNMALMDETLRAMEADWEGLLFVNLVDFDMLYGHRNDVEGYGRALEAFDRRLTEVIARMREDDLLLLTADHGCDPSITTSTDHTREYVPILAYGKSARAGVNLGTRDTMADIGQTIAENFGFTLDAGTSFLASL